tara:strand:+ start:296 stop:553 length:258 start_codon:yes stop_codon:yes gene_type:complete
LRYANGDEGKDEIESFFDETMEDQQQYIQVLESQLDAKETNRKLLAQAIRISEKSFFWKFFSLSRKLNIVKKTYVHFVEMTMVNE